MADYKYADLSVHVVDQPDSNQYALGVEIGGAFVPFAILKKNAVESDIAEAQQAAAEQEREQATAQAQREQQAAVEQRSAEQRAAEQQAQEQTGAGDTPPSDSVAPHATQ
jgi:regulator of protease activity HflC (stomatin/prohibitin superfamily)